MIVQLPLLPPLLLQCYPHWALTCGQCCFSYHHSCYNDFGAVTDVLLPPLLQCYAPPPSMLLLWHAADTADVLLLPLLQCYTATTTDAAGMLLIPLMCYRRRCCNIIPPPHLMLLLACYCRMLPLPLHVAMNDYH